MTEEAFVNTYARMGASALTWPIEKSKLLYQGGNAGVEIWTRLTSLPVQQHAMGMISSGLQRGGSAFFMFYTQSQIYDLTNGRTNSFILDQALAGGASGAITAPFHTYWELIKVRGTLPCMGAYRICLFPMICRHAIFDFTFFGVNASLGPEQHAGGRFALAAAAASFSNLLWDVWKTQQMEHFPQRVRFGIILAMPWSSFVKNYLVKGTDLTANWFVVGCLKERFFPRECR